MRPLFATVSAAALFGAAVLSVAPAQAASECLKEVTTLDHRYGFGITAAVDPAGGQVQKPPPAADKPAPPGPNSQLDTVPNTGGVTDRPPDELRQLSADMRRRVAGLLQEAKQADSTGDGTVCADRLRQARQIAQQASDAPSDLH
jgi:hypothetical protein